ncbi:FhaA domain-containing protein [Streptomyces yerevanensis]|uniref:FhaA domain-containing protein n=1 Tax=Streptomyces yerevanensis TaxID=66378 RepID=UPI00068E3C66|nr:FhaA domain-containing protein [Streptomyces yerevanensis]
MEECARHSGGQRQKMKPLAALEHTMERWSNALWTLLIRSACRQHDQSELVRTLHQECDDRALILDRRRILVPNAFVIELPPESHEQLTNSSRQLDSYLSNHVRKHAAEQGYTFAGPVAVRLTPVERNKVDRFRVRSYIAPTPDTTKEEPDPQYG